MPVDDDAPKPLTRRERLRRQTIDEIVEHGLRLVDAGGAHGLSLAAVGKAMGMTPPALYHYIASREALLEALVVAGYTQLGAAVEGAAREAAGRPAPDRVAAIARAWRRWALDHPCRYTMLFADRPREGAHLPESLRVINRGMLALVPTLQELTPADGDNRTPLGEELARWGESFGIPEQSAHPALRLAVSTWYRVHGLVSLEILGAFASMRLDGEQLLTAEVESLVREAGRTR